MFKEASKLKLRFKSDKGLLTVEDLWDLPLRELDGIAQKLSSELKCESFITAVQQSSLEFDIVKHIITDRLTEVQLLKDSSARSASNSRIREIMASKQDDELRSKSIEELEGLIEE